MSTRIVVDDAWAAIRAADRLVAVETDAGWVAYPVYDQPLLWDGDQA